MNLFCEHNFDLRCFSSRFNGWNDFPEDKNNLKQAKTYVQFDREFSVNLLTERKTSSISFLWSGFELTISTLPASRRNTEQTSKDSSFSTIGTLTFRRCKTSSSAVRQDVTDFLFRLVVLVSAKYPSLTCVHFVVDLFSWTPKTNRRVLPAS